MASAPCWPGTLTFSAQRPREDRTCLVLILRMGPLRLREALSLAWPRHFGEEISLLGTQAPDWGVGGQASRAGWAGGGGRGCQCRLGSSRAGKRRCPSDHGSVPGGVQPGGEQAGGGRAGTAGLLGGGGEGRLAARRHSRGCAQKPPVTTPSASTGWTICSTWPTESRGNVPPPRCPQPLAVPPWTLLPLWPPSPTSPPRTAPVWA